MPFEPELHARRRAETAERMRREGGGVLLLPQAEERFRNNDAEYLFRPDSDHVYLTGFDEPSGCALLVVPREGNAARS